MQSTAKRVEEVVENINELSSKFALERRERQQRRELDKADFDALTDAGFHLTGVPPDMGGINGGVTEFTRPLCEMLRILAKGDPSVSLVSSMHPAVIGGWLEVEEAPQPYKTAWEEQRRTVFETARDGCWWGTIISEPGSGGDPSKSRATAKPLSDDNGYLISGQKHFGSGSGITSFMITQAVPVGEAVPDVFYMDMRDVPWDGSSGATLTRAWDGHGMTATQSHAMDFAGMLATRAAWPDNRARQRAREIAGRPAGHLFTSVIVGVVEAAVETARRQVRSKKESMRPFEQVEWSRVEMESWLIQQAYEGVLRDVESGNGAATRSGLLCKEAVAELSDSVLQRISKVVGGGAYSRSSPYGFWLQDVRALGFLRPPWGFAFDRIFDGSWYID
jgi:alkylation response protein AidB-like acyl-CoA dehydrogenase